MFVPFNLFSNQPPPGSSWCLRPKMFVPPDASIQTKIILWPAKHSSIHDTFQCLLPPWSLGFNISRLAILSIHSSKLHVTTLPTQTLQLLFLCMESYFHRYSYVPSPHFIQVSPEISLCEKSLLWLPSLNWPIFIIFYFFILLWFSSPPGHYIIYFNLLHCLCLQL